MEYLTLRGDHVQRRGVPELLLRDGVVLLRGANRESTVADLSSWAAICRHPDSDELGVTTILPRADRATSRDGRAFSRASLALHTDRSTTRQPPAILACVVTREAGDGGESLLLDGRWLLEQLWSACERQWPPLRRLGISVEGASVLPMFDIHTGRCVIHYRDDAVGHPYAATRTAEILIDRLHQLFAEAVQLRLGVGEGYIVHNHRYLHGRTGFSGDRELLRVLARVNDDSPFRELNDGFPLRSQP